MFTMHDEKIYIPYKMQKGITGSKIGYVISNKRGECRDRFAELMGTDWAMLYESGWRIVPCEVIADEYKLFPKEYSH